MPSGFLYSLLSKKLAKIHWIFQNQSTLKTVDLIAASYFVDRVIKRESKIRNFYGLSAAGPRVPQNVQCWLVVFPWRHLSPWESSKPEVYERVAHNRTICTINFLQHYSWKMKNFEKIIIQPHICNQIGRITTVLNRKPKCTTTLNDNERLLC